MGSVVRRVLGLIFVLAAAPAFCAERWQGFHGAESQGQGDSSAVPLHWSSSENVVWKTAIPGRGHSSPIVSGDAVYVTTTYEKARLPMGQNVWTCATFALMSLCTVAGVALAVSNTVGGQRTIWRYLHSFLFGQVLISVVVVVLFGRRLLDWDGNPDRFVPTAAIVAVACLLLVAMSLPWKRRQPDAEAVQDVSTSLRWSVVVAGIAGAIVAIAPFALLLYRAADYQVPDSYVLDHRVRPDMGWLWIGLYVGLVLLMVTVCLGRSIQGRGPKKALWQTVFFVALLSLGTAHFAGIGLARTPKEFVRAIVNVDRNSGKVRWICEGLTARARSQSRVVTHASATPVVDGSHIFGYFGEDGLMCAGSDGTLLWKRTEPLFRCKFGVGTSPVVSGGILVVVSDVKESEKLGSFVAAFDCNNGVPLWRTQRESHPEYAAYCTPAIEGLAGRQVILVHGWHDVKGYDLRTGEELWSYPLAQEGHHLVASPVTDVERLYIAGPKEVVAMELGKLGTADDPVSWRRQLPGEKSATPVVVDGMVFLVTEPGMAFCLDARTGKILWKERLKGRYFSSVVSVSDKVFFTNESGLTTVIAADRQFREVAKNGLGESVYASIAPVGDCLFVRTTGHLYCIEELRRWVIRDRPAIARVQAFCQDAPAGN